MRIKFAVDEDQAIGLIPARGGSKSIPLKNLALLADRPLISYVIAAARRTTCLHAVYCSTDHEQIARVCSDSGVEVIARPAELGQDDTPVSAVIQHVLETLGARSGRIPGIIALLQPTSPFLLPHHVEECVYALRSAPEADSSQTITRVYHNAHAFNQRVIANGRVRFRFLQERREAYNKQMKPHHYVFGNVVVSRSRALLEGKDCFGDISVPVEIPAAYALDLDTAEDFDYASYLISAGRVSHF